MNYYNEIDPFAAGWLRALIRANLIPDGKVDERSIEDVKPNELTGFCQCHFFAGIGGWPLALQLAGWPADRPVWTGSCPCQPFSAAGKGKGVADERHLWPAFHWLIAQCRPEFIFGEQVANKAGEAWFDIVQADLAGENYASGMCVFPACGVGAPQLRKRLYWGASRLGDGGSKGSQGAKQRNQGQRGQSAVPGNAGGMADSGSERLEGERVQLFEGGQNQAGAETARSGEASDPGPTNGQWRDVDWLYCRDEKWRAVEPGTFPLASGVPARVGRLRGYGNAIVPTQAAEFVGAFREVVD